MLPIIGSLVPFFGSFPEKQQQNQFLCADLKRLVKLQHFCSFMWLKVTCCCGYDCAIEYLVLQKKGWLDNLVLIVIKIAQDFEKIHCLHWFLTKYCCIWWWLNKNEEWSVLSITKSSYCHNYLPFPSKLCFI